jgi:hypothetical protein
VDRWRRVSNQPVKKKGSAVACYTAIIDDDGGFKDQCHNSE